MSDNPEVYVSYGDNASDTATLLLAAAEELDQPAGVVRTSGWDWFIVPKDVAEQADVDYSDDEPGSVQGTVAGQVDANDPNPQPAEGEPEAKPASKRATKKTASKSASK